MNKFILGLITFVLFLVMYPITLYFLDPLRNDSPLAIAYFEISDWYIMWQYRILSYTTCIGYLNDTQFINNNPCSSPKKHEIDPNINININGSEVVRIKVVSTSGKHNTDPNTNEFEEVRVVVVSKECTKYLYQIHLSSNSSCAEYETFTGIGKKYTELMVKQANKYIMSKIFKIPNSDHNMSILISMFVLLFLVPVGSLCSMLACLLP